VCGGLLARHGVKVTNASDVLGTCLEDSVSVLIENPEHSAIVCELSQQQLGDVVLLLWEVHEWPNESWGTYHTEIASRSFTAADWRREKIHFTGFARARVEPNTRHRLRSTAHGRFYSETKAAVLRQTSCPC
jgi:hypothetical protein